MLRNNSQIFRSKKDLINKLMLLYASNAFVLIDIAILAMVLTSFVERNKLIIVLVSLPIVAFARIKWHGYNYLVADGRLYFRTFGWVNYDIPISTIKRISKFNRNSRTQVDSGQLFGLSFDGLVIETHKKHLRISPQDEGEFVKLLSSINPSMEIALRQNLE